MKLPLADKNVLAEHVRLAPKPADTLRACLCSEFWTAQDTCAACRLPLLTTMPRTHNVNFTTL